MTSNEEAVRVVNLTVFIVGGAVTLMIIGLLIYFFIMRNKTLKIDRKTVKKGPEHQMLSLVTIDHRGSSPDRIMPYPVNDEKNANAINEQHSANLAGSIMTLVKVDSDDTKVHNLANKESKRQSQIVRFTEPKLVAGAQSGSGHDHALSNANAANLINPMNQRDMLNRSPVEHLEAAMIMDSTS